MIVLDASVALKWFVDDEPLVAEARAVLADIERDPRPYGVPEFFMNELVAVLLRTKDASADQIQEAIGLVESLGLARFANGHDLLKVAIELALRWDLSGYDAAYVALASLSKGIWLTADERAAAKIDNRRLVRVLGNPARL